eukprot:gene8577-6017_t
MSRYSREDRYSRRSDDRVEADERRRLAREDADRRESRYSLAARRDEPAASTRDTAAAGSRYARRERSSDANRRGGRRSRSRSRSPDENHRRRRVDSRDRDRGRTGTSRFEHVSPTDFPPSSREHFPAEPAPAPAPASFATDAPPAFSYPSSYYPSAAPSWQMYPPPPPPLPPVPTYVPPPPPPADPNDPRSVALNNAVRAARIMELLHRGETQTGELSRLLEEQQRAAQQAQGPAEPQQQQQQQQAVPVQSAPQPEQRDLPSVQDFIPVIPTSLLAEFKVTSASPPPATTAAQPAAGGEPASNALSVITLPKIAPVVESRAREARRAHVSGFPIHTVQEELLDFFRSLLPKVRRAMTVREMTQLADELQIPPEDRLTLPANAQTGNVDIIRDLTVSTAKSKKFAFVELNLADMITELVDLSTASDPSLTYIDQRDGRPYMLTIRRPRDYDVLVGVDETKVVMTGFPPAFPEDSLRLAFEGFGDVQNFQVREEFAYAEFPSRDVALQCREGLHGAILAKRMMIVLPLYDWLKVVCSQAGIDVTIDDSDPISGRAVLEMVSAEAEMAKKEQHRAAAEGVLALVKNPPTSASEFMNKMLTMSCTLSEMVFRLSAFYPHLRPLYGNTQVVIYPTRVLALLNMFDEEELVEDSSYSALRGAIELEVERHGRVEQLVIPRREPPPTAPRPPERCESKEETDAAQALYEAEREKFKLDMDLYYAALGDPVLGSNGIGNVYVVYRTVEEAEQAQLQIAGKLFSGRTVVTCFLFEDLLLGPGAASKSSGDADTSAPSGAAEPSRHEEEAMILPSHWTMAGNAVCFVSPPSFLACVTGNNSSNPQLRSSIGISGSQLNALLRLQATRAGTAAGLLSTTPPVPKPLTRDQEHLYIYISRLFPPNCIHVREREESCRMIHWAMTVRCSFVRRPGWCAPQRLGSALLVAARPVASDAGSSSGQGGERAASAVLALVDATAVEASSPTKGNAPEPSASTAASTRPRQAPRDPRALTPVASFADLQRVERRRSKLSVHEAEFAAGISERLWPSLPRLPVLHEVHFSDAVVREVDGAAYFASHEAEESAQPRAADASVAAAEDFGDLSDDAFASFDSAGAEPAAEPCGAPPLSERRSVLFGGETLDSLLQRASSPVRVAANETEWIVRPTPLSPQDCHCLLRFLMHLRQQTPAVLPPWLQQVLSDTEAHLEGQASGRYAVLPAGDGTERPGSPHAPHRLLRMEHITRYLDGAPPPVKGFTEDLADSASSLRPALLFTLYLENISVQNAVGHLCMLFAVPLKSFYTRSLCGKMTCSSLRCAVAPGRLSRHHLLLVNTMRLPGFVLRVSDISEHGEVGSTPADASAFFGALARWQPVYEVEVLLRRVGTQGSYACAPLDGEADAAVLLSDDQPDAGGRTIAQLLRSTDPRSAIQGRLLALQRFGAVHFIVNRDTSLARAASDVIHGYYKSALLHALQRPNAPLEMQHFFQAPNEVSASKARAVSTDSTVRAALKAFLHTKGNWHETLKRTPYAWRRRWINALRGLVWNVMAAKRIRYAHRSAKEALRRGESVAATLQRVIVGDVVVLPAYREDCRRRQLLTLKAEHLMVVRTAEEAAGCTLEDVYIPFLRGVYPEHLVAPEDSDHPFMRRSAMLALLQKRSAAALLVGLPPAAQQLLDCRCTTAPVLFRRLLIRPLEMHAEILEDKPPAASHHFDACRLLRPGRWPPGLYEEPGATGALLPPSAVLEHTSMGDRLPPGVLPSEFLQPAAPGDYLVLGQTQRLDSAALMPRSPLTPPAQLQDRLYTIYLRAVCHSTAVGLSQMLREYFLLLGVKEASERRGAAGPNMDEVLQHKVHRLWRELDPETPQLTASTYCRVCFSRDHDAQEQCAEYLWKRQRDRRSREVADRVVQAAAASSGLPKATQLRQQERALPLPAPAAEAKAEGIHVSSGGAAPPAEVQWHMNWLLRKTSSHRKWGVHFRKTSLALTGLDVPDMLVRVALWAVSRRPASSADPQPMSGAAAARLLRESGGDGSTRDPLTSFLSSLQVHQATARPGNGDRGREALLVDASLLKEYVALAGPHAAGLRAAGWRLHEVDGAAVQTVQDVAAAFGKASAVGSISLVFVSPWAATRATPPALVPQGSRPLPPLPSFLYLDLREPLAPPPGPGRPSWGLTVRGEALVFANLDAWARKALLCQLHTADGETPAAALHASSPEPSALFSSSWAEAILSHLDPTNPHARLVDTDQPGRDTTYDYTVFKVNGRRVNNSADLRKQLPRAKAYDEVVLRLELRLRAAPLTTRPQRLTALDALEALHHENEQLLQMAASIAAVSERSSEAAAQVPAVSPPPPVAGPSAPAERQGAAAAPEPVEAEENVNVSTTATDTPAEPAEPAGPPAWTTTVVIAPEDQKVLPASELVSRLATVAVHRPPPADDDDDAAPPSWGIRLQKNSTRLLHVKLSNGYSYHVYAYTTAQVRRMERGLRAVAAPDGTVHVYRTHVYTVEEVGHHPVATPEAVRCALGRVSAGLPPGPEGEPACMPARRPEVVLLKVRDYPLLRLRLRVARGLEFPPMSPIGLHVDADVCVVGLAAESPAVAALEAHRVARHSSLWRYVGTVEAPAPGTPSDVEARLRDVCALPTLVPLLLRLRAAADPAAPRGPNWDVDDDDAVSVAQPGVDAAVAKVVAAQIREEAESLLTGLKTTSHVDAVQLLQLEQVRHAVEACVPSGGAAEAAPAPFSLTALIEVLGDVHRLVRWRVVYAEGAKRVIRSGADLTEVLAPGVMEETIVLQQCVVV